MKVLILNGSPHVDGCTKVALNEVSRVLNEEGITTEIIEIGSKDIRGCIGCYSCKQTGKCVFNDLVNEVAAKFKDADGLIVGSPVYFGGASGTIRAFLDRLFYSTHFAKTMKVGAAVVSSRRAGSTTAFDEINKYFTISSMPIVASTYWNEIHGSNKEEAKKDLEGLQTMRNLGKNMAFLIKSINTNKESIPEQEKGNRTNFCDGL